MAKRSAAARRGAGMKKAKRITARQRTGINASTRL